MKKVISLAILIPILSLAQKKTEVFKKTAIMTCECANKKDVSTISNLELGLCIFESLDKLTVKEKKTIGYDSDRKVETVETVAKSVGVEMALVCPEIFSKLSDDENDSQTEEAITNVEEVEEDLFSIGIIESITSNEFNTINIINENNEKEAFIWLFSFDGDSLFIKEKAVKGDKIKIYYVEQQFFDPKTNRYQKYKEITEIELL